ncbi:hypothetical protein ACFPRA_00975 [Sporosarcina soli]|uniref:Uncharacterized protein n=1 Tax=Sporosarcina soli TaxID=334736 RepID=A0ABW0TGF5_9BACL
MHFYAYPYLPYPYVHPGQLVIAPPSYHAYRQTEAIVDPHSTFPAVDTNKFNHSAQKIQSLTKQMDLFTNKVIASPQFAKEIMEAAQLSNTARVHELIISTGVTVKIETQYTPTGIIIEFNNADTDGGCCHLRMVLPW